MKFMNIVRLVWITFNITKKHFYKAINIYQTIKDEKRRLNFRSKGSVTIDETFLLCFSTVDVVNQREPHGRRLI